MEEYIVPSEPKEEEIDRSVELFDIKVIPISSELVEKSDAIYQELWPDYYKKIYTGEPVYKTEEGNYVQIDAEVPQNGEARYVKYKDNAPKIDGISRVSKFYDNKIGRVVAGKTVLYPQMAQTIPEARTTAQFNHPNIITVHDLAITNTHKDGFDEIYLIMEWMDRGDLFKWMESQRDISEVVNILNSVSEGVTEINNSGRVYSDLKPNNIMFKSDGSIKIIDLGITTSVDDEGKTRTAGGNSDFAPQEQIEGRFIDKTADTYAFGALVYYILTGERNEYTRKQQISDFDKYKVNPKLKKDFSNNFENQETQTKLFEILSKSLSKNKEDRYQNIDELNNALQNILNDTITSK